MDKNSAEALSPCAKFSRFQLTYSCCDYCVIKIVVVVVVVVVVITIVWTYTTMNIHKDKKHQRSRKGRKRPENGVTSATIY